MSAIDIFVATNSIPTSGANKSFQFGRSWQYHPRSDRHSKTACWAVLFDLFQRCNLLKLHAQTNKIGIAVNHPVLNISTGKSKNLDFVIQRIDPSNPPSPRKVGPTLFSELATELAIVLTPSEQHNLASLPDVLLLDAPNAPVLVALEAKACMTEHIKSKPRLFDELNSSHSLVHGASIGAISAGWALINTAPTFISPTRNNFPTIAGAPLQITEHKPDVALKLAKHLATLPVANTANPNGFDAFGISMVSCANDGSPLVNDTSAPVPLGFDYARFLSNLEQLYSTKFAHI